MKTLEFPIHRIRPTYDIVASLNREAADSAFDNLPLLVSTYSPKNYLRSVK